MESIKQQIINNIVRNTHCSEALATEICKSIISLFVNEESVINIDMYKKYNDLQERYNRLVFLYNEYSKAMFREDLDNAG